jgi:hypothetical protein
MSIVGIGNKEVIICVRHFPGRKKPCLVIERGNQGLVVGTFRNEQMTEEFEKAIIEIFGEAETFDEV